MKKITCCGRTHHLMKELARNCPRVNVYRCLNRTLGRQMVLSYLWTGVLKPDSFSPLLNPFPGQIIWKHRKKPKDLSSIVGQQKWLYPRVYRIPNCPLRCAAPSSRLWSTGFTLPFRGCHSSLELELIGKWLQRQVRGQLMKPCSML